MTVPAGRASAWPISARAARSIRHSSTCSASLRSASPRRWPLGESGFGTLLYLAPEILRGGPASVQADIYAFGVVLYQLVIGDFTRPFAPDWQAGVPDELLRGGYRAGGGRRSRQPDRRCGHAGSAPALARSAAHAAGRWRRAIGRRTRRRRRALERAHARRGPLLVLFATLLIGLSVSVWLYLRAEQANRRAQQAAATSEWRDVVPDQRTCCLRPIPISAPTRISASRICWLPPRQISTSVSSPARSNAPPIEEALGHAYSGLGDAQGGAAASGLGARRPLETAQRCRSGDAAGPARPAGTGQGDPGQYRRAEDGSGTSSRSSRAMPKRSCARAMPSQRRIATRYGSSKRCIEPLKRLMTEARNRLGPHNEFFLESESTLAKVMALDQRFDEAIPMAREALALTAEVDGPKHPLVADRKYRLAEGAERSRAARRGDPVVRRGACGSARRLGPGNRGIGHDRQ